MTNPLPDWYQWKPWHALWQHWIIFSYKNGLSEIHKTDGICNERIQQYYEYQWTFQVSNQRITTMSSNENQTTITVAIPNETNKTSKHQGAKSRPIAAYKHSTTTKSTEFDPTKPWFQSIHIPSKPPWLQPYQKYIVIALTTKVPYQKHWQIDTNENHDMPHGNIKLF